MKTLEWIKSKAVAKTYEINDSLGKLTVNSLRFEGKLPYRMRKELETEKNSCGYLQNGNEYSERIITIRDKLGNYQDTIYVFEEFVKCEKS